jgi:hypothetical protein
MDVINPAKVFPQESIRKMDIKKVDLLLKYILAAAGQEDYGNRRIVDIA